MCKVFFSTKIINHDTGHNKFVSENISVSNEKNLTHSNLIKKNRSWLYFLITAVFFFLFDETNC